MTAIDELLTLLKEQGFEHYRHEVPAEENCVAFYDGNRWHDCWESVDGEVNVTFSMTPQEAIAATIGDTDATPTRHDGACSDEILSYLDGEFGRDSFEYDVYSDLYDMASEILDENAKLREEIEAAKHDLQVFSANLSRLGAENAKLRHDLEEANNQAEEVCIENAKLRELVDGLTWCCENYGCRQECPLYDVSEPDHCREVSIKRELGIEVDG